MQNTRIVVQFNGPQLQLIYRAAKTPDFKLEQFVKDAVKEHMEDRDYDWPPDEQG